MRILRIPVLVILTVTTFWIGTSCSTESGVAGRDFNINVRPEINPTPVATVARVTDDSLVVPGRSVGPITLGISLEEVGKIIPFRQNFDAIHQNGIITTPKEKIKCAAVWLRTSFLDRMILNFSFTLRTIGSFKLREILLVTTLRMASNMTTG
jgi:hypothetical protein